MSGLSRWVTTVPMRGTVGPPPLRLFVFPHAGSGSAPYRAWAAALPPGVQLALVQLPGREARLAEASMTRMGALVDALAPALLPLVAEAPAVFFGHSMGAHVAFETARRLGDTGSPPRRLLVSGNRGPSLPYPRERVHGLGDERLLAEFRRLGGTSAEVLAHEELMALLRPILRADLELCETYERMAGEPLDCALTAFGGAGDPDVPTASLEAWRRETTGAFRAHVLPGGHFFLQQESRAAFLDLLAGELADAAAESPARAQPRHG